MRAPATEFQANFLPTCRIFCQFGSSSQIRLENPDQSLGAPGSESKAPGSVWETRSNLGLNFCICTFFKLIFGSSRIRLGDHGQSLGAPGPGERFCPRTRTAGNSGYPRHTRWRLRSHSCCWCGSSSCLGRDLPRCASRHR